MLLLKKWKRRWIILLNSESSSEKEILIFKNEKSAKDNDSCKKIPLEDLDNIFIIDQSQERHIIELIFKDGVVKRLLFSLESAAKEWQEQLNLVCFDSVIGKKLKEAIDDDIGHTEKLQEPSNEDVLEPNQTEGIQ